MKKETKNLMEEISTPPPKKTSTFKIFLFSALFPGILQIIACYLLAVFLSGGSGEEGLMKMANNLFAANMWALITLLLNTYLWVVRKPDYSGFKFFKKGCLVAFVITIIFALAVPENSPLHKINLHLEEFFDHTFEDFKDRYIDRWL